MFKKSDQELNVSYPRKALNIAGFLKSKSTETPQTTQSPESCVTVTNDTPKGSIYSLELLPQRVLFNIFYYSSPQLSTLKQVSKSLRHVATNYIDRTSQKFLEMKIEAECWAGKAPQLIEVLHLDALVIEAILLKVFDGKLSNPETCNERVLVQHQKQFFKILEHAMVNYQDEWHCIDAVKRFIYKHNLHFKYSAIESVEADSDVSLETPMTLSKTTSQKPNSTEIDGEFNEISTKLFILAAENGHLVNLVPVEDLEQSTLLDTIQIGIKAIIKSKRRDMLAFLVDQIFETDPKAALIDTAIEACISLWPCSFDKSVLDISRYLADCVCNDQRFSDLPNIQKTRQRALYLCQLQRIKWNFNQKYIF